MKWHSSFLRISHNQRWSVVIGKFHQRKFNDRSFVYYRMVVFHSDVFSHQVWWLYIASVKVVPWRFEYYHLITWLKINSSRGCVLFQIWFRWWWRSVFVVSLTNERSLAFFLAWTNVRDPYSGESPTHCEQDLNLLRTRVQDLLNEVV